MKNQTTSTTKPVDELSQGARLDADEATHGRSMYLNCDPLKVGKKALNSSKFNEDTKGGASCGDVMEATPGSNISHFCLIINPSKPSIMFRFHVSFRGGRSHHFSLNETCTHLVEGPTATTTTTTTTTPAAATTTTTTTTSTTTLQLKLNLEGFPTKSKYDTNTSR